MQVIGKPAMGILNMQSGESKYQLVRHAPSDDLRDFVKHYWIVHWDLTGEGPYDQAVLPNPCVNLVIEKDRALIYSPATTKYTKRLEGQGCAFGVKFKPGGFYPFIKQPISSLADAPLPASSVFEVGESSFSTRLLALNQEERMVQMVESVLRTKLPEYDPQVDLVNQIVDLITKDREITQVEQLGHMCGMNVRALQRLFSKYVGVTPKRVIQLYRLQEAAESVEQGSQPDWLEMSHELGYHDQAHFIKDFKSVLGMTPDEYARGLKQF